MSASETDALARRLLQIKEKLEQEKARRAELQGELKSLLHQLESEFGVSSLEEAEQLLEQDQKALQEMEEKLRRQVAQLEEQMEDG